MAGFHNLTIEWVIRIVIAVRLGAHISLALLAGIRRHKATGFLTIVLWLAYQVAQLGRAVRPQQPVPRQHAAGAAAGRVLAAVPRGASRRPRQHHRLLLGG